MVHFTSHNHRVLLIILLFLLVSHYCLSVGNAAADKDEDYYKILGIPKNANDRQIKKAYHKLSMKYHP